MSRDSGFFSFYFGCLVIEATCSIARLADVERRTQFLGCAILSDRFDSFFHLLFLDLLIIQFYSGHQKYFIRSYQADCASAESAACHSGPVNSIRL